MIWLKFLGIQLVMLLAAVAGALILPPFCLLHAWTRPDRKSVKDDRQIDRWWLIDFVVGNREDGASGKQALVWVNGVLSPYMPSTLANPILKWLYDAWRAYRWSALRNSCDNLKYVFADPKGPLVTFRWLGRTGKIGWQWENGYNVPVGSL